MTYSSRFWLYAPISAFLLLAAAAMVHWWMLAGAFEKKLASLKGREAVPTVILDWDSVEVGGFPFRLDASFINFRATGNAAHGPFRWKTEKLALHALTYGRRQTVYEAAGRQTLNWADKDDVSHTVEFLPGSLHASSVEGDDGLRRFDVDVVDAGSKDFTIGRFQFHMRRDPDGKSLDLMLRADNWNGKKLVQAYATLSRADLLAPLLAGNAAWDQAVAQWKRQGGRAKLSQLRESALAEAALTTLY